MTYKTELGRLNLPCAGLSIFGNPAYTPDSAAISIHHLTKGSHPACNKVATGGNARRPAALIPRLVLSPTAPMPSKQSSGYLVSGWRTLTRILPVARCPMALGGSGAPYLCATRFTGVTTGQIGLRSDMRFRVKARIARARNRQGPRHLAWPKAQGRSPESRPARGQSRSRR